MTLDPRLEGLVQSLQLMASKRRENEAWHKRFEQITWDFEAVHNSIKSLEKIALAHKPRLDDLEGQ